MKSLNHTYAYSLLHFYSWLSRGEAKSADALGTRLGKATNNHILCSMAITSLLNNSLKGGKNNNGFKSFLSGLFPSR